MSIEHTDQCCRSSFPLQKRERTRVEGGGGIWKPLPGVAVATQPFGQTEADNLFCSKLGDISVIKCLSCSWHVCLIKESSLPRSRSAFQKKSSVFMGCVHGQVHTGGVGHAWIWLIFRDNQDTRAQIGSHRLLFLRVRTWVLALLLLWCCGCYKRRGVLCKRGTIHADTLIIPSIKAFTLHLSKSTKHVNILQWK